MEDCIEKEGVVEAIKEGEIVVRFARKSACADCHAKQSCTSLDVQDKVMEFVSPDSSTFKVGEHVAIRTTRQSLKKAVFLAFILPLVLLLASLSLPYYTPIQTVGSYWITGMVVITYYIALYILKKQLNRLIPVHVVKSDFANQIN